MSAMNDDAELPDGNGNGVAAADDAPPYHPPPDGNGTPLDQAQRILGVNAAALAGKLREARQAKGLTRTRLAQMAGLAPSTVSNLERERSGSPDPVTVLALAIALGYDSAAEMMDAAPAKPKGEREHGPGPMTLAGLIEGLLRGVWAAQDGQSHAVAQQAILEKQLGQAVDVLRAAQSTPHPILAVGVVVLNEPRRLG